MLRKILILVSFLPFCAACQNEISDSLISDSYIPNLINSKFTGDQAYNTTAYVEKYWRVVGNSGFDSSINKIVNQLKEAGFKDEASAGKDQRFTYSIEKRALKQPTWEPINANVKIEGEKEALLEFSTNRNMIAINSYSTKKGGVTAEVIYVKNLREIKKSLVEGKIVFAEKHPYQFYNQAVQKSGALGIISYNNPDYIKPEKNTSSIQFKKIPYDKKSKSWCVVLSYAVKERLKEKLQQGKVKLNVNISTKIYKSKELTVVAKIKGKSKPNESLVFSAHVQEPGANDNASGVGVALEMASLTAQLVKNNELSLKRTLTFLWGDEIVSTRRFVTERINKPEKIKWGISLDMVGENTDVTGGSFLIEKMPDPSAIWTRGKDKHTEWGGSKLKLSDMKPHYLNDFLINRFKEQGKRANWQVNTNPFEGGSDHEPFLNAGIPSVLFWHFTDQFYHTDNDRMDKVSKTTLKNVGTAALISAITLLNADENTAISVANEIKTAALARLNEEQKLSLNVLESGDSSIDEQKEIIEAWKDWYIKALSSCHDLDEGNAKVKKQIEGFQKEVTKLADSYMGQLGK